jgi:hypothetical protein
MRKIFYSYNLNFQSQRIISLVLLFCSFLQLHLSAQVSKIHLAHSNSNTIIANSVRQSILLDQGWATIASDSNQNAYNGFENPSFIAKNWKQVRVPHSWDQYEGYRRMLHGNKHGYAWYKKIFKINGPIGKRYFLYFEGVGSYATVWLNGYKVGYHAGGRTSFTLDITQAIKLGQDNFLAVRADHPPTIQDLPWVCGGCSEERGFSEGSQPMGIFRPVHLIITDAIHIVPFGVHIWNDTTANAISATIQLATTIQNDQSASTIQVVNTLLDQSNKEVATTTKSISILAHEQVTINQELDHIHPVQLWSVQNPYLYQLKTAILYNGKVIDAMQTAYGIRTIKWDRGHSNQFLLNGQPVFINGIAEYEHALGNSHAFSNTQILSRVKQVQALGFNAFRDAHQPHNLAYQNYWDEMGILWWPQLSAHVWFDNLEFRNNFKTLLKEWVIERRNNPSNILWGLQNESKLPADFAKECVDLIRSLDPTASSQRLITTCNGGEGTDWDVPQNWTGTYGGNINTYQEDIKRQVLVGEYGAWRTLDLHTEGGFKEDGIVSEDRMTQLLETKIKLAEQSKDSCAGQFFWLLNSHDNPGRVQSGEALRGMDCIGPVNYKGLLTPWEEPTDAYYMFKSNYTNPNKDPMVYIVSHTWPDRWTSPGIKDNINVYSNCEEVELFNDLQSISLGKQKRNGIGTHFQWNKVPIQFNVLYAVGYINGKAVAKDIIVLNHLPIAPHLKNWYSTNKNSKQKDPALYDVFRVNCGGGNYTDSEGNKWLPDLPYIKSISNQKTNYYSSSWTNAFPELPAFFASQRQVYAPIKGTMDWSLFQQFRYGRDSLQYHFTLPNGDYIVELYFIEPWLGIGSTGDYKAMRVFDVAINQQIRIKALDIWKEVGTNSLLKKQIPVHVLNGRIDISFPNVLAGQALISAIRIATTQNNIAPATEPPYLIQAITTKDTKSISNANDPLKTNVTTVQNNHSIEYWLKTGDLVCKGRNARFSAIPASLYGAVWIQSGTNNSAYEYTIIDTCDVYVTLPLDVELKGFSPTNLLVQVSDSITTNYPLSAKRYFPHQRIQIPVTQTNTPILIFLQPIHHMQPAYDLKKIIAYRPGQAVQLMEADKQMLYSKESIVFKSAKAAVNWNINIGAADIYSITLRYANETSKILHAQLQFISADGVVLKRENMSFIPSKNGKWNYAVTNTGTMVNAGNYTIQIKSLDAEGLVISALDIQ